MWVLFLLSKCSWAPYANLLILWSPVNFKFHISVFSHIYTTYGYSLSFSFLFLSPRNFSQLVCIWFYSSSGSLPFLGHAVCFLLLLHQFCFSALYPHRDTNQGRGRTFFVWLEPWDGPPKPQNVRQWDPAQFLCEVSKGAGHFKLSWEGLWVRPGSSFGRHMDTNLFPETERKSMSDTPHPTPQRPRKNVLGAGLVGNEAHDGSHIVEVVQKWPISKTEKKKIKQ